MITVTITECHTGREAHVSRHRTADANTAIKRAVQKAYGKPSFLVVNQELSRGTSSFFGQVGRCLRGGDGVSLHTDRVRIDYEDSNVSIR